MFTLFVQFILAVYITTPLLLACCSGGKKKKDSKHSQKKSDEEGNQGGAASLKSRRMANTTMTNLNTKPISIGSVPIIPFQMKNDANEVYIDDIEIDMTAASPITRTSSNDKSTNMTSLYAEKTQKDGDKPKVRRHVYGETRKSKSNASPEENTQSEGSRQSQASTQGYSLKTQDGSVKTQGSSVKTQRDSLKTQGGSLKTEDDSLMTQLGDQDD